MPQSHRSYKTHLSHYGILGMHWGVRRNRNASSGRRPRKYGMDAAEYKQLSTKEKTAARNEHRLRQARNAQRVVRGLLLAYGVYNVASAMIDYDRATGGSYRRQVKWRAFIQKAAEVAKKKREAREAAEAARAARLWLDAPNVVDVMFK